MSRLDMSKALFGSSSRSGEARNETDSSKLEAKVETAVTRYGTVLAYSNGIATVQMDGSKDDDGSDAPVSISSSVPLGQGQRVTALVSGTDITVVPDGGSITAIAEDVAGATNQYFFHDSNGAHVATVPDDPDSGRNVTLNSYGLLFRDGTTDVAKFTPTEIKLGENCTLGPSSGDVGTVGISLMNDMASIAMKRLYVTNSNGQGGSLLPCLVIESARGPVRIPWLWVSGILQLDFDGIAAYNPTLGGMRSINSSRGGAATLSSSAAQSTVSGTEAKLQLRAYTGSIVGQGTVISGDNSLFHAVRNGNVYGDDMYCRMNGTVLVSAQVYCQSMTSNNNLVVSIYQNSTKLCEVGVSPANSSGMATAVIPPRAVSVSAGDTFALYAKSTTAVTNGIPIGGAALTVQYI